MVAVQPTCLCGSTLFLAILPAWIQQRHATMNEVVSELNLLRLFVREDTASDQLGVILRQVAALQQSLRDLGRIDTNDYSALVGG